jgi:uncharacterized protein DUF3631
VTIAVADLLDVVAIQLRRYVVLSPEQTAAVALWVFHTHVIDAAQATPYLSVHSAQKESGKSRLLEVLELLVRTPLPTANISDAALFRVISEQKPTLLFDEVDAIFGPKARDREDLRGMLNAGYRRGARVYRMGGNRMIELQAFEVFSAKALAGIGKLPDTIASRSIPIRLKRRAPSEAIERFRRREVEPTLELFRIELEKAAESLVDSLAGAHPELPDQLSDRAQDVWEPLFAIADMAGGEWAAKARHAAVKLCTQKEVEDDSIGVLLLADIRTVSGGGFTNRMSTKDLIAWIAAIEESPWATYGRGEKLITATQIASLLRPFEIHSRTVRLPDGATAKGYLLEQFYDAFARYLPSETSQRHNADG